MRAIAIVFITSCISPKVNEGKPNVIVLLIDDVGTQPFHPFF